MGKVQFSTMLGLFCAGYDWKNQNFPWERGERGKEGRGREKDKRASETKIIPLATPSSEKQKWGPSVMT